MRRVYLSRQEYFDWANSMSVGEIFRMYLSAIELGKREELPPQTLAYDEAKGVLYICQPDQ